MQALQFASFWMGGFEGADHRNGDGTALDMVHITRHDQRLDEDYAHLIRLGIRTVRESIGWRLSEPAPGRFDFERLQRVARTARRHGMQVLWTLMHYGMPDDLQVLDSAFVPRFALFARAAARVLADVEAAEPAVVTPVNEIGYLAWVLSETTTMAGGCALAAGAGSADSRRSGYALKCLHRSHACDARGAAFGAVHACRTAGACGACR
jgi:glycosyl hydrolase family 42 (putative beta-galactosidase)